MTIICKDIPPPSKSDLEVARYLIHNMLERLIPGGKICKRDGAIVLLRKALDDTGFREVQMFKVLRTTLGSQIDKTVKGGPAIAKFVNKGIKVQGGKTLQYNAALKELHKSLEKSLGPVVAKQTAKDVAAVVEKQWLATKAVAAKNAAKAKRAVSRGITKVDRGTLKVLNGQNNFFISGFYNTAAVDKVNSTIAGAVKQGIPKREMGPMLRTTLPAQIASRGDAYYQILANDVLQRARSFAQVNAFVEARIRRYEIFAVIDERTTEICEYMDGRTFDVEIARKIVKDITRIGIPGNDKEAQQLKAFRPWLQFNKGKALDGKNALFFRDAKGKKIYLPGSGFSVDKAGKFTPTGAKTRQTSREIVDATPKNSNPPQLPPFHGRCRTTFSADEEDIQTQNWTTGLTSKDIGPGMSLFNEATKQAATTTAVNVAPTGRGTVVVKPDVGKTKTMSPGELIRTHTVLEVPKPPPKRTIGSLKAEQIPPKQNLTNLEKMKRDKKFFSVVDEDDELLRKLNPMTKGDQAFIERMIEKYVPDKALEGVNDIGMVKNGIFRKIGPKKDDVVNIGGLWSHSRKRILLTHKRWTDKAFWSGDVLEHNLIHEIAHSIGHSGYNPLTGKFGGLGRGTISDDIWRSWIKYDTALQKAPKGAWVSDYAKTDLSEHFAEVFATYYHKPAYLKLTEPKAYAWLEKHIAPIYGKPKVLKPLVKPKPIPAPPHPAEKIRITVGKFADKKLAVKSEKMVRDTLKEIPEEYFKNLKTIRLFDEGLPNATPTIAGDYNHKFGLMRLSRKHGSRSREGKTLWFNTSPKELRHTIAHELSHGVHGDFITKEVSLLQKEIWRDWIKYDKALRSKKRAKWVSPYAKEENVHEHFAECFGWWYTKPEMLAKKEPAAFEFFTKHFAKKKSLQ